MNLSEIRPDSLVESQLKRAREAIGMAMSSYNPGVEDHSSSGAPYVIYGEHMWVYLGFTPCADVRGLLEEDYDAVFGRLVAVEPSTNQETPYKDLGFTYGTPFVGIPLPK